MVNDQPIGKEDDGGYVSRIFKPQERDKIIINLVVTRS